LVRFCATGAVTGIPRRLFFASDRCQVLPTVTGPHVYIHDEETTMTDKLHSETLDVATAVPEQAPASPEASTTAAEPTSPVSIKTEAGAGDDSPHDSKAERRQAQGRRRRASNKKAERDDAAPAATPCGLAERLLAPIDVPPVTLDRRLLPPKLLAALDAAGLGAPDVLPAAAFMTLASLAAIAGATLGCEPGDGMPGNPGVRSLRVALLAQHRHASWVPEAILAGALAVENDLVDVHQVELRQAAEQRRAAAARRRLYEQVYRAAAVLGAALPQPLPDVVPAQPGPRPRIVVCDGADSAIRAAAAGGTGLLLIDERRMASMFGVAGFYDRPTGATLNALAAGHQVAVENPKGGRTEMRSLPISVIGTLTLADCALLHKAGRLEFTGTVFVAAAPPPAGGDGTALEELMRAVRPKGGDPVKFRLPADDTLKATAASWAARAAGTEAPLCDYLGVLPDLARRLAMALHLAAAAGADGGFDREISHATVKRAVTLVDTVALPLAQALLAPISIGQVERDARRVITFLRETTSGANNALKRRALVQSWQHSMPVPRINAALGLLQEAELLVAVDEKGGPGFKVDAAVYAAG
jgi:hypothetical protein